MSILARVAAAAPNYVGQAAAIAGLPSVKGDSCNAVIQAIQSGGKAENYINTYLGTDFQPLNISPSECSLVTNFVPLVGSYNDLLTASKQYDPSNQSSVNAFYVKSAVVAAQIAVVSFVLDEELYQGAFRSTAELNDALKLGKLQELCGEACYSDALSSIHWFIRNTASQYISDSLSWAGDYIQNLQVVQSAKLPPVCSIPILNLILSFFGICH